MSQLWVRSFSTFGENISRVTVSLLFFDPVPCFQTARRMTSGATLGNRLSASAPHSPSVTLKASVIVTSVTMICKSLGIDMGMGHTYDTASLGTKVHLGDLIHAYMTFFPSGWHWTKDLCGKMSCLFGSPRVITHPRPVWKYV